MSRDFPRFNDDKTEITRFFTPPSLTVEFNGKLDFMPTDTEPSARNHPRVEVEPLSQQEKALPTVATSRPATKDNSISAVMARELWNELPFTIRAATSVVLSKHQLKTQLFKPAFN